MFSPKKLQNIVLNHLFWRKLPEKEILLCANVFKQYRLREKVYKNKLVNYIKDFELHLLLNSMNIHETMDDNLLTLIEVASILFDTPWNLKTILLNSWKTLVMKISTDQIPILRKMKTVATSLLDPPEKSMTDGDSSEEELDGAIVNTFWADLLLAQKDNESYTTSYPFETMKNILSTIDNCSKQSIMDISSTSYGIPKKDSIISTLSTTVHGMEDHVDAASSKDCQFSFDIEKTENGLKNVTANTSKILQPRRYVRIIVGGISFAVPMHDAYVSDERDTTDGPNTMVESEIEGDGICTTRESNTSSSNEDSNEGSRKRHCKSSIVPENHKIEIVLEFFKKYTPSPLLNGLNSKQWLNNNKLKFLTRDDQIISKAVDIFQREILHSTIEDFSIMFSENSIFGSVSGNIFDYYLDIETSVIKLKELLIFQCGDEYSNFINLIYKWFNRINGKLNTILIKGPPNACKTLFVHLLLDISISNGQIANFNKYNAFPLQNCLDKRLLYWDEPNFEPSSLETLKMLFAGDKCPANIKYKDHQIINKTPVIITTNKDCFPKNNEFTCRILRFYWNAYNLENNHKKIHPLALFEIFKEEKLLYINDV